MNLMQLNMIRKIKAHAHSISMTLFLMIFETIIRRYNRNTGDFYFIEIGACDGKQSDLFYKYILRYGWGGILIEPVRHLFHQLKNNYLGRNNIIFENVAISDNNSLRDFYYLKDTGNDLPACLKGIGSFSREHLNHYAGYFPETDLVSEKVQCMTFKDLIRKHQVQKIDLLIIDTEGHDFEIIKSIDFKTISPLIIHYEHVHLSLQDKIDCEHLLRGNHYILLTQRFDTTAFLYQKDKKGLMTVLYYLSFLTGNRITRSFVKFFDKK